MLSLDKLTAQPPVISYKYALKVQPTDIQKMSKEELQTLCLEQAFLLWLIISIIRNPLAAIASRIIAVDLLTNFVERNLRGSLKEITERSRIYISGEGGIAKRLGIHPNTVSKSLKNLETHQLIKRDYVYDEQKQKEYLDITLTPIHLRQPMRLQDKAKRKLAEAGTPKKQKDPQGNLSIITPDTLSCPSCGSENLVVMCRDCGTSGTIAEFEQGPQIDIADDETNIVEGTVESSEATASPTTQNLCSTSNNAPQDSGAQNIAMVEYVSDEGTIQDSVPTTEIVQDIVASLLTASPAPQPEESPRPAPVIQPSGVLSPGKTVSAWFRRRVGHGKIIYATGLQETSDKYRAKPRGYRPDLKAYLQGDKDHVYGSYLLGEDGTTYVLAFDLDQREEALYHKRRDLLRQFARAGATPICWVRQNNRAHIEFYFDGRIVPEAGLAWCLSVYPDLRLVEEVYPAETPACDKRNNPISWPLFQRRGNTVLPCRAEVIFPDDPETLVEIAPGNIRQLADLVRRAVTPANLVLPFVPEQQQSVTPQVRPTADVGALSDADIAKIVIADFNKGITWEELAEKCGGMTRDGKFPAAWRVEKTASVKADKDGRYACDYGRTAGYPRKFDKYECWCLITGGLGYKKTDLARRCKEYREAQGIQIPSVPAQPDQVQQENTPVLEPQPLQVRASTEIAIEEEEDAGPQGEPVLAVPNLAALPVEYDLIERYNLRHGEACEKCGCELERYLPPGTGENDQAGSWECARCYPQRGYHLYSDLVEKLYPRRQRPGF